MEAPAFADSLRTQSPKAWVRSKIAIPSMYNIHILAQCAAGTCSAFNSRWEVKQAAAITSSAACCVLIRPRKSSC